jgi:hypothetical protein
MTKSGYRLQITGEGLGANPYYSTTQKAGLNAALVLLQYYRPTEVLIRHKAIPVGIKIAMG